MGVSKCGLSYLLAEAAAFGNTVIPQVTKKKNKKQKKTKPQNKTREIMKVFNFWED